MSADDDMISMFIIKIIIMMMVMIKMTLMEIMMLEAPMCENVLQILDMTTPKPRFERVQISFCCRTQWKVTRPGLRSEREETHHLG